MAKSKSIQAYVSPALQAWLANKAKQSDHSLSEHLTEIVTDYAKQEGFREPLNISPQDALAALEQAARDNPGQAAALLVKLAGMLKNTPRIVCAWA